MDVELHYLPHIAAVARAASTLRRLLSKSGAAAAAATIPRAPLHPVPLNHRRAALVPQMICSLIEIKTVGVAHRCPSTPPLPNQTTATCSNGSPQRDVSA
ncbi:hypothetical protein AB205_0007950 [Aquarana catesbeiana]|uniref:Uncharacterized protein n=1 Tax=Aquarana catesbeiana TaxID=8400 RepID=A0A2G9RSD9_AQUCT|nr:hypothetical protein AB205_0007950 [Aquarana catesbeiana]